MENPVVVTTSHRVGPYNVIHSADELSLNLENRGELSVSGCLYFGAAMAAILVMGCIGVLQTIEKTPLHEEPSKFFSPSQNHFGFLWLFGIVLMLVFIPYYVIKSYKAALVFTFRKSDDAFLRDNRLVTRLRKVEFFRIEETKDPDGRYLYLLNIVYNDGQEMLLHNGYDEREIMNLANELSAFLSCPVRWA
jgi:hypothetical protein